MQAAKDWNVIADLPCRTCGYNLYTLTLSSVCPECGESIRRSREAARTQRFAGSLPRE